MKSTAFTDFLQKQAIHKVEGFNAGRSRLQGFAMTGISASKYCRLRLLQAPHFSWGLPTS